MRFRFLHHVCTGVPQRRHGRNNADAGWETREREGAEEAICRTTTSSGIWRHEGFPSSRRRGRPFPANTQRSRIHGEEETCGMVTRSAIRRNRYSPRCHPELEPRAVQL